MSQGVSGGQGASSTGQWQKWIRFCNEIGIDPFLEAFEDKIPIIKVFIVHQVQISKLAAKGNKIKSWLVEDYLRAVAQTFLVMGANNSRLNVVLNTDFRLARMFAASKEQDPPANRVKPVPVAVIHHIAKVTACLPPGHKKVRAAADMIITAFSSSYVQESTRILYLTPHQSHLETSTFLLEQGD